MHSWDRKLKNQVRSDLLEGVGKRTSALFLPGVECRCVIEALERGIIGARTHVHAVECEPPVADEIEGKLRGLGIRYTLHRGILHEYAPAQPLDYAMIDLMGHLDLETAQWLRGIVVNSQVGFRFDLIVLMSRRNSTFLRCVSDYFTNRDDLLHPIEDENPRLCWEAILYVAILRSVMRGYTFKVFNIEYRDKRNTMLAFQIRFIEESNEEWPSLEEITNGIGIVRPQTKTKRRKGVGTMTNSRKNAAHKAWETRRKKQQAAEALPMPKNRREAETMLRAAQKWLEDNPKADTTARTAGGSTSCRSEAARKAWETRRRNGWVHPSRRFVTSPSLGKTSVGPSIKPARRG